MKLRAGFVSNSSSSSFIVGFKKRPKSMLELKALLFGNQETRSVYDYLEATETLAEVIWQDLEAQPRALSKKQILEYLGNGYLEGVHRDLEEFVSHVLDPTSRCGTRRTYDFDAYKEACRKDTEEFFEKSIEPHLGKLKFYHFEYEDHSPIGSTLEHGDTFEKLPNVRISHH